MIEAIKEANLRPVKPVSGSAEEKLSLPNSNVSRETDPVISRSGDSVQETAKRIRESEKAMINRIAEAIESYIRSVRRELQIQVHADTGKTMVRVISQEDGKVIREIPAKEMLDLAAKLDEMTGILIKASV